MEKICIHNAGLVLCGPFLPRLFSQLRLTGGDGFVDRKSAERAAELLQYLLYESTNIDERDLALNKLLCGLEIDTPIDCSFEISQHEKDTLQDMLKEMLRHWGRLENASPRSLIDSFMLREGKLSEDVGWCLEIEEKGYDVLLDSLPWSFSTLKYAWMEKPLHVRWR